MKRFLNISGEHYRSLKKHLFPGDGKESVAFALCGRCVIDGYQGLTVYKLHLIPDESCFERTPVYVKWPTDSIRPLMKEAVTKKLSLVKIHCHPGGGEFFSDTDEAADIEFYNSLFSWSDDEGFHASLIMLPGGRLFGSFIAPASNAQLSITPIDRIRAVGENIQFWNSASLPAVASKAYTARTSQVFGEATTKLLGKMRIAVVGCSGTGSPVVEQLFRNGVGEIYLIDHDTVEEKNLNRILNTTMSDIGKFKVDVIKTAIERTGLGTKVHAYPVNLFNKVDMVHLLGTMDFIFGCTDSVDSRHLLNLISTYYLVPYIDMGVKIVPEEGGGVDKICASVNYLSPGYSLMERGVYTSEDLRAASAHRTNPAHYHEQLREGYIVGIPVNSPAVISPNMNIASWAVMEMFARLHDYRYVSNREFDSTLVDYVGQTIQSKSWEPSPAWVKKSGRGDIYPLLETTEFSDYAF